MLKVSWASRCADAYLALLPRARFPIERRLLRFSCAPRPVGPVSPDLARGIHPFVDLLLTRREERKKPHQVAGRMSLMLLGDFGCGGRI